MLSRTSEELHFTLVLSGYLPTYDVLWTLYKKSEVEIKVWYSYCLSFGLCVCGPLINCNNYYIFSSVKQYFSMHDVLLNSNYLHRSYASSSKPAGNSWKGRTKKNGEL